MPPRSDVLSSDQPALELALPARPRERQGGHDREPQPRIVRGPAEERVDELVRLAQAERDPEHDLAADLGERVLDARFDLGVVSHRRETERLKDSSGGVDVRLGAMLARRAPIAEGLAQGRRR